MLWARERPEDLGFVDADTGAAVLVGTLVLSGERRRSAYRGRATRYGCGWKERFGEVSRAAFDLLHRRYSQSPWTAKNALLVRLSRPRRGCL